jgi:hypothetical protein
MLRAFTAVCVVAGLLTLPVAAQTQNSTDLSSATPQENAAGGSVSLRSPGTWVRGAITRHTGLQGIRLTGPRFGQPNTEEAQLRFGNNQSGTSSTTGGLSGLLDLLNQVGGIGGLSNLDLGNLTNLAGGLTGTGGSTTGTTTTGGSTDGASALADLIALGQTAGGTAKTANNALPSLPASQTPVKTGSLTQTRNGRTYGGAIARLPKPEERFQTSTPTTTTQPSEPSFGTRWLTAMTETFFSAVALGMQTPAFVNALADALRPLVLPQSDQTAADTSTDGTSNTGGDTSTDGTSNTGGDTSTDGTSSGGIENLSPPAGNGGSSGGTI